MKYKLKTFLGIAAISCCNHAASSFQFPSFIGRNYLPVTSIKLKPTSSSIFKATYQRDADSETNESRIRLQGASEHQSDYDQSEETWIRHNLASTTPQLLYAIWSQIIECGENLSNGKSITANYPNMHDQLTSAYVDRLMLHMHECMKSCDDFGVNTFMTPHMERTADDPNSPTRTIVRDIITGFTIKSKKNRNDEDEKEKNIYEDSSPTDKADDDTVISGTKNWIENMIAGLKICPFAASSEMAGVPLGQVHYTISRCSTFEEMYESFWKEVVRMEHTDETDLSTTVLIMPEFCSNDIQAFDQFSSSLKTSLHRSFAIHVEFHPEWISSDGNSNTTQFAANYARRSPWPMINILRVNQVQAGVKTRTTGLLEIENNKTLSEIGCDELEKMLKLKDWSGVAEFNSENRAQEKELKCMRPSLEDYKEEESMTQQNFFPENVANADKVSEENQKTSELKSMRPSVEEESILGEHYEQSEKYGEQYEVGINHDNVHMFSAEEEDNYHDDEDNFEANNLEEHVDEDDDFEGDELTDDEKHEIARDIYDRTSYTAQESPAYQDFHAHEYEDKPENVINADKVSEENQKISDIASIKHALQELQVSLKEVMTVASEQLEFAHVNADNIENIEGSYDGNLVDNPTEAVVEELKASLQKALFKTSSHLKLEKGNSEEQVKSTSEGVNHAALEEHHKSTFNENYEASLLVARIESSFLDQKLEALKLAHSHEQKILKAQLEKTKSLDVNIEDVFLKMQEMETTHDAQVKSLLEEAEKKHSADLEEAIRGYSVEIDQLKKVYHESKKSFEQIEQNHKREKEAYIAESKNVLKSTKSKMRDEFNLKQNNVQSELAAFYEDKLVRCKEDASKEIQCIREESIRLSDNQVQKALENAAKEYERELATIQSTAVKQQEVQRRELVEIHEQKIEDLWRDYEAEIQSFNKTMATQTETMSKEINDIIQQFEEEMTNINSIKQAFEEESKKSASLEKKIKNYSTEIEQLKEANSRLNESIKSINEKSSREKEAYIRESESMIQAMKNQMSNDGNSALEKLRSDLKSLHEVDITRCRNEASNQIQRVREEVKDELRLELDRASKKHTTEMVNQRSASLEEKHRMKESLNDIHDKRIQSMSDNHQLEIKKITAVQNAQTEASMALIKAEYESKLKSINSELLNTKEQYEDYIKSLELAFAEERCQLEDSLKLQARLEKGYDKSTAKISKMQPLATVHRDSVKRDVNISRQSSTKEMKAYDNSESSEDIPSVKANDKSETISTGHCDNNQGPIEEGKQGLRSIGVNSTEYGHNPTNTHEIASSEVENTTNTLDSTDRVALEAMDAIKQDEAVIDLEKNGSSEEVERLVKFKRNADLKVQNEEINSVVRQKALEAEQKIAAWMRGDATSGEVVAALKEKSDAEAKAIAAQNEATNSLDVDSATAVAMAAIEQAIDKAKTKESENAEPKSEGTSKTEDKSGADSNPLDTDIDTTLKQNQGLEDMKDKVSRSIEFAGSTISENRNPVQTAVKNGIMTQQMKEKDTVQGGNFKSQQSEGTIKNDEFPVITEWEHDADGSLTDIINNSKLFNEGDSIFTSPITEGVAKKGSIVMTESGSKYRLM